MPSPAQLAELSGAFAMTANVHDPDPADTDPAHPSPATHHRNGNHGHNTHGRDTHGHGNGHGRDSHGQSHSHGRDGHGHARDGHTHGRDNHDHDHDHHDHHGHHNHHDEVISERGLRGLVGGGASQVSVSAAMRARDAARPTADDLAAADRDLQIIRRGWVPREELARPGHRPRP